MTSIFLFPAAENSKGTAFLARYTQNHHVVSEKLLGTLHVVRKFRMILNVKKPNKYILSRHFKMKTLNTCLQKMRNNWHVISLDLKDAYFTIPMHEHSTKFEFHKITYIFLALPKGFKDSFKVFTKIMKPVLSHFRLQGIHIISVYNDDINTFRAPLLTHAKNMSSTLDRSLNL